MKKRIFVFVLCLLSVLLCACGLVACGSDGGFELTKSGNEYIVTGYNGSDGKAEIPAEYMGKPVTAIMDQAFVDNTVLTEVTVPSSVVSIGKSAFKGCSNLSSITLPFVGAAKEETAATHFGYIFGANSYGENGSCVPSSLKTVTITGGAIKKNAFDGCSGLTEVTVGDEVNEIGWSAFFSCSNLNSVRVGDGVKALGYYAFENCIRLKTVYLGKAVNNIGYRAFYNCDNLTDVTLSQENGAFAVEDGMLYTQNGQTLVLCVSKQVEGEVVVADGVTLIDSYAFRNCKNLTGIQIPDSVTRVGDEAFYGCESLMGIRFSDSVTSLGKDVIDGCVSMEDVIIGKGIKELEESVFADCVNLVNLALPFVGKSKNATSNTHFGYLFGASNYYANEKTVPASLKKVTVTNAAEIDAYAFYKCKNIMSLSIADSVSTIGEYAFAFSTNLTKVVLGSGLRTVGDFVFNGCHKLVELCNKSSLNIVAGSSAYGYLGYYAKNIYSENSGESKLAVDEEGFITFDDNGNKILVGYGGNQTELVLPSGIEEIYKYAFYSCNATVIEIPDSFTVLGASAFRESDSLTDIKVGNGVTALNNSTFRDCKNLSSITIGMGVSLIERSAFYGCVSLKDVYYKGTQAQWNSISRGNETSVDGEVSYLYAAEIHYNS